MVKIQQKSKTPKIQTVMKISQLKVQPTSQLDQNRGLVAWLKFTIDDMVVVDSVALRKKKNGEYALSFPARRDSFGALHNYIRPIDDRARREIEKQVFSILDLTQPE